MSEIVLNGGLLSLDAVAAVARDRAPVTLAPEAISRLQAARALVDRLASGAEPVYGITTGVGKLKDVVIPVADRATLQRNLVLSHAGGVGAPLSIEETRAVARMVDYSAAMPECIIVV